MSPLTDRISSFLSHVNRSLFSLLDDAEIEHTPKLLQLATLLELLQIERFAPRHSPYKVGVKPKYRQQLLRTFVAKAFYNATDTKAFRERLLQDKSLRKVCGWAYRWEIPSESTFSRVFTECAETGLTDTVHAAQVDFWYGDSVIRNVSTDSSAIPAREKPVTRAKPKEDVELAAKSDVELAAKPKEEAELAVEPASGKKKKQKKDGAAKASSTPAEPTRLERQITQVPEIALLELATACDVGCKTNSKGNKDYWIGYKFHVRVADGKIPLIAVTTAASVHDSQVAIPLMKMSDRLVTSLYELMDRGYDAKWIRKAAELAGHVPIIDYIRRRGQEHAEQLGPDRAEHYKGRTVVEQFNGRLKDEFGGNHLRVRGPRKVHAHLMFGTLVIFADQILRTIT
ncbi:MAG: transposase [bacterium]